MQQASSQFPCVVECSTQRRNALVVLTAAKRIGMIRDFAMFTMVFEQRMRS